MPVEPIDRRLGALFAHRIVNAVMRDESNGDAEGGAVPSVSCKKDGIGRLAAEDAASMRN
jgi:hypothetical protein